MELSVRSEVEADLERLGKDLINSMSNIWDQFVCHPLIFFALEARVLAPQLHAANLTQYDEWGRRVDLLQTSEGWRKLKETASKEGYIANAYERKYKELSRVYMFAKTMVMTGDYHVVRAVASNLTPQLNYVRLSARSQWLTALFVVSAPINVTALN